MIADYTAQIRQAQPSGPYRLMGWSLGGSIAWDIARQLEQAGCEVAFLGLVDSTLPEAQLSRAAFPPHTPRPARHSDTPGQRELQDTVELFGLLFPQAKQAAAEQLHDELAALGVDVLLDDRGERPGAMFADWELIGVPHRVTIGDRGLKEGMVEYQNRRDAAATKVATADILAHLKGRMAV